MDFTPVIVSILLLAFSIPSVAKLSRYRGVKSTIIIAGGTIIVVLVVIISSGLALGVRSQPWIFRWTIPVVLLAIWVVLTVRVADCQGGKAGVEPSERH